MRELAAGLAAAVVLIAACGPPPPATRSTATPSSARPTPSPTASLHSLEAAYERVITNVLPSIVQITTKVGLGSGIVFDSSGHIVTNAHVVGQAKQMNVTIATGGAARSARLVKSFAAGDLAVIKVDKPDGLRPAKFGDSAKLRVGQIVLAMGNPLGLSGSVTNGIVSALGRTVTEPQNPGSPGATIAGAIQTSAAINPGNSGGALVDLSGQVIGIPTLAATDPELGGGAAPGIGFAIPSNTATDIAAQIVKYGKVTNTHRAALGIRGSTVVGSDGQPSGVAVATIEPGGAAQKAGIEAGDTIVSINGKETPTMAQLAELLTTLRPGARVKVGVTRPDDTQETVNVTLGQLPGE
ncbi:serine protease, S1-C subfamily, contains C-terminal PDZ domain [Nonomuraea solani]|uniref:Serine protease, S1-C subfamily, contains C-terminal PDZ domain n=1 Tax=Nonomuraea solani TaxID=1144553 RepID=A0A1H6BYV2_9ACTN|nr:trypsin-like peptidase domain-containing protein [Nonomuraea solani]SEG65316.1 serine protease, S1-C subfamily, contains C-terminal PDZ domain [Nonomuraea solani]